MNLGLSLALVAALCVLAVSYALVVRGRGRPEFPRLDKEVASPLLRRGAYEPLYAVDPDYQPALFYVRAPIVYVPTLAELPADAREVLVQTRDEPAATESRQWWPRRARPVFPPLKDYRNKSITLLRIGSDP